jgi:hypothetical protein
MPDTLLPCSPTLLMPLMVSEQAFCLQNLQRRLQARQYDPLERPQEAQRQLSPLQLHAPAESLGQTDSSAFPQRPHLAASGQLLVGTIVHLQMGAGEWQQPPHETPLPRTRHRSQQSTRRLLEVDERIAVAFLVSSKGDSNRGQKK